MSTPYGISTSRGSVSYNSYVNTPITGPLNTNQYPGIIPYHRYGMLTGLRPTPPLFYPSQEPVNADQNTNSRHQYFRTAESSESLAINRERAIVSAGSSLYSFSTGKRTPTTSHANYIPPTDSSLYIQKRRAMAVGKSAYKVGLPYEAPISTKNYYPSGTRSSLRRARSGGCVAPKKKGAIENTSLNSGACGWGSIVRSTY
jgi:hypothetical protein